MFDYIEGVVDTVGDGRIVLDVHGAGFSILSDAFSRNNAVPGEKFRLFTQMRFADERIALYGFEQRSQRDLFRQLTAVTGVGPRLAMSILSALQVAEIVRAVLAGDEKAFQNVSGVGKKTAQRLLLELKGKPLPVEDTEIRVEPGATGASNSDAAAEAAEALEGLGYSHQEALAAVNAVHSLADTPEDLVRLALKRFGVG